MAKSHVSAPAGCSVVCSRVGSLIQERHTALAAAPLRAVLQPRGTLQCCHSEVVSQQGTILDADGCGSRAVMCLALCVLHTQPPPGLPRTVSQWKHAQALLAVGAALPALAHGSCQGNGKRSDMLKQCNSSCTGTASAPSPPVKTQPPPTGLPPLLVDPPAPLVETSPPPEATKVIAPVTLVLLDIQRTAACQTSALVVGCCHHPLGLQWRLR